MIIPRRLHLGPTFCETTGVHLASLVGHDAFFDHGLGGYPIPRRPDHYLRIYSFNQIDIYPRLRALLGPTGVTDFFPFLSLSHTLTHSFLTFSFHWTAVL